MKTEKKIKAVREYAYGILNAYGEFWTNETFMTEETAQQHIRNWELKNQMLPNHTVIPVLITPLRRAK